MEMKRDKKLDISYALIQAFYFMIFCALLGFASVYLLNKGFNNRQIGMTLALASVLSVGAQPVVGAFLDKNKKVSMNFVIICSGLLMIVLSLILYFNVVKGTMLLLVFTLITVAMMTLQPLMNSLCFSFEKKGIALNFGLARGVGSVAYATISFGLGLLLEKVNSDILPIFYILFTFGLLVVVYFFQCDKEDIMIQESIDQQENQLSLQQFVKKYKKFMIFLIGVVCVFVTHSIINNFFIQVIHHVGGTSASLGSAIFVAAILELPAMILVSKIQEKVGCVTLLRIAAIFFSIKIIITYIATNMTMLYVAQVSQMFGYAIFIPVSVYYVSLLIDKQDGTKGQAMVTGAITLGGVFASLAGGIMLDVVGVSMTLLFGLIISVVGSVIIFMSVEKTV